MSETVKKPAAVQTVKMDSANRISIPTSIIEEAKLAEGQFFSIRYDATAKTVVCVPMDLTPRA